MNVIIITEKHRGKAPQRQPSNYVVKGACLPSKNIRKAKEA